ncbi:MAG: hypothetical protein J6S42_03690 [Thermoguttaceae bacterium]|nr:hypothetical protein [Thermoguttaceae bacterium]
MERISVKMKLANEHPRSKHRPRPALELSTRGFFEPSSASAGGMTAGRMVKEEVWLPWTICKGYVDYYRQKAEDVKRIEELNVKF